MPEDRTTTGFGDERATLLRYLEQYRSTLASKCADLDAEQLARLRRRGSRRRRGGARVAIVA